MCAQSPGVPAKCGQASSSLAWRQVPTSTNARRTCEPGWLAEGTPACLQDGDGHGIDQGAAAIPAYEVELIKDAPKSAVDQWVTGGGLHHSRCGQLHAGPWPVKGMGKEVGEGLWR